MRAAGILMPVTSLPSPWGVGTLGAVARRFVDFLAAAGMSVWQVLPVVPSGFGDSPYQSFSTFAGNPYLIDLDDLAAQGLLEPSEYAERPWGDDPERVDYGALYRERFDVLRCATGRLLAAGCSGLDAFCVREAAWLDDYALFMARKDAHGGAPWDRWEDGLRRRQPDAIARAREDHADDIQLWKAVQYLFFRQWEALHAYAGAAGVRIMGDLPFYVAGDSADVWSHPEQFELDGQLRPHEIAGVPPDAFSEIGQVWGNPLFDWERMREDGYRWWFDRVRAQFALYDIVRIDHFRGFDSYFAIPAGSTTAAGGRWRPGPGIEFFRALKEELGAVDIVAEDLGYLTPSVRALLADTGFPGMKILEFAFDSRDGGGASYLPFSYPTNCVAYVGTHDNDTALGWLVTALPDDVAHARAYLHLDPAEGEGWGFMRAIWASPADLAIVQMQDLLELGSEARINVPSTTGGNWCWRAVPGFDSDELAARVRRNMELYYRI